MTNFTIQHSPRRLSVSSWSLHRSLGAPPITGPGNGVSVPNGHDPEALLALPGRLPALGIHTLELCHFHLPSRDPGYLRELAAAMKRAGVSLFSFLVDGGDIADPDTGERDMAWIAAWMPAAEALGASRMRVVAGKQPPSEATLQLSLERVGTLAEQAAGRGIRLMTENWFPLLFTPQLVHRLLEGLDGAVGLCLDFGNWSGEDKYERLEKITPLAESCHAKAAFDVAGEMDRADYERCLDLLDGAGFQGPYTLIFDSPALPEEEGLRLEAEIVRERIG